ncbi:hypothetical protein R1flu_006186 [Riccia fluitans]|uniref:Uncharacterized protein n=1 Tax=Riccia fluitans TaxID=41844 RepID=A0ABD1YYC0_9MARC
MYVVATAHLEAQGPAVHRVGPCVGRCRVAIERVWEEVRWSDSPLAVPGLTREAAVSHSISGRASAPAKSIVLGGQRGFDGVAIEFLQSGMSLGGAGDSLGSTRHGKNGTVEAFSIDTQELEGRAASAPDGLARSATFRMRRVRIGGGREYSGVSVLCLAIAAQERSVRKNFMSSAELVPPFILATSWGTRCRGGGGLSRNPFSCDGASGWV